MCQSKFTALRLYHPFLGHHQDYYRRPDGSQPDVGAPNLHYRY